MPKISALPAGTTPTGVEKIAAVQGGATVELTAQQIANLNGFVLATDTRFGVVGDNSTLNDTAIAAAVTYCVANNLTLAFPDGNYKHSGSLNWAFNRLKVIALGNNVIFRHTGTGVAHSFSGITNYPATQGCADGVFGGPNAIIVVGNANTTNAVLIDNWHFGEMNVAFGGGCSNAFVLGQDTGIVGACAVTCTFRFNISTNVLGAAFTATPLYGVRMTSAAGCTFLRPIVEFVGNVSSSTTGVSLVGCIGNTVLGGTIESCLAGGVAVGPTCLRNTFIGVDVEVNGTQQDWLISGNNNTLIGCSGGGTTAGQFLAGNNNRYVGCKLQSVVVQTGALDNTFEDTIELVAWTDNGTRTNIERGGPFSTAANKSTLTLFNKSISGANNTLAVRIANDVTGLGTGIATALGVNVGTAGAPVVNGGALGTPATGVATNLTGTAAGLTAGNVTTNANSTGAVTSVGNATSLGSFTSSNLAGALTDEVGTGNAVFASAGTWTPTDQSGATLTFTSINCKYQIIGNMVYAYGTFTFPSTANGATVLIGGLPVAVPNASYAAVPSAIKDTSGVNGPVAVPVINSSNFNIFLNGTAANAVNSLFTTSVITVNISYPAS